MRKLILSFAFVLAGTALFAQNFDDIQEKIGKGKYDEAKEKLDKLAADAKATSKSDFWYLKAKIYNNLAKASMDSSLMAQSKEALVKYYQLENGIKDESKRYIRALFENHSTAFEMYSNYANAGIKNFQEKKWAPAYNNFVNSLNVFDVLVANKLTTAAFDTTMNLYAGFSAQNAGMPDNAVIYYGKIADARIADTSYAELYEYLVNYYMTKKDQANMQKYLAIGKSLFPKRDSWVAFEMEGLGTDKVERLAKFQDLLQSNPGNFALTLDYAVELFNYTYGKDRPADYTARLEQLTTALNNAIALNKTSAYANFIMTQHLSNQIYDLQQSYSAVKGTKPEDVKKKTEINKTITAKYEELLPYATAAYQEYEKMADIKPADKANWRNVTNLLIDYYSMKKNAERTKFYEDKVKTIK